MGDLDGDGAGDLAAPSPGRPAARTNDGYVTVHAGPFAGTISAADHVAAIHGRTSEGDSDPEDLSPTVTGKFWIRLGYAIKKASGVIGVASVGMQLRLPTERLRLLVAPTVVNAFDNPVGSAYTELLTTGWMPLYALQEIAVAYESFDADNDFRYTLVLHSVKTDPTQEAPAEDTISDRLRRLRARSSEIVAQETWAFTRPPVALRRRIVSATTGASSGVASTTTFSNASSNKAQLCRVVLKADNNAAGSGVLKRGRVYLAVANRYE